MAKTYAGQSRHSGGSLSLLAVAILIVGVLGGALLLHAAGIVKLPFLEGNKAPAEPDRTGMVEIPVSAVAIPAYAQVVREHLWDARRGRLTFVYLRQKDVTPEMLTTLADVLGGVLRRDKPAGYVFTKADFFPKGTRPGPSAGIPPGKRAMRMQAKDLPGLHGLKQGDKFDVVMAVEVEIEEPKAPVARAGSGEKVEGPYAGLATPQTAPQAAPKILRKRAEVRTVVKEGVVVEPVSTRKEIETSSSLMRGTRYETKPIEEIVIAVEPEEVAALQQAIAIKATLHVAMRSGQATADGKPVEERDIPNLEVEIAPPERPAGAGEAPPPVRIVEVIQGGKKKLMAVPVGPQPPEGEAPPEKAPEKAPEGTAPAPEGGSK